jgi:hypothetical protein
MSDNEYQIVIDNTVPIPIKGNSAKKYPFGGMQVGDSFALPISEYSKLQRAAHSYGNWHKKKFTVRNEGETVRVWRIK